MGKRNNIKKKGESSAVQSVIGKRKRKRIDGGERWERHTDWERGESFVSCAETSCGQTKTTVRPTSAQSGRNHLQGARTRKESCSRKSVSRQNNQTLPSVNAAVYS